MDTDFSRDIISLTDFRDHLTQKLDDIERHEGMVVVTRNGRAAAIVLAPKAYEKLRYEAFVRANLVSGLTDIANGRTLPHAEVMRQAKARVGSRRRR